MDWKGKINFEKAITLNGKPHGVEFEPSLPTFDAVRDSGRVVFTEDDHRLYVGGTNHETETAGWSELTPGGIASHSHDNLYYTVDEVNNLFEGTFSSGIKDTSKKQIDWSNVINTPTEYTPTQHNNDAHLENYLVSDDVTFTFLSTDRGLVGTAPNQLALGNHNHRLEDLSEKNASSVVYNNTTSNLSATELQSAVDELDSRIDFSEHKFNKIYLVDNTRTDTYTEKGDTSRPFKTIQAAINEIDTNDGGFATIILSQSIYTEDLIIGSNISIKAMGSAELSGTIVIGTGTPGSNVIENITFKNSVTLNMLETTSFSNVSFEGAGHLIIVSGSAEGDISINTTTTGVSALTLEPTAGTFFGASCSFSSDNVTIQQEGGDLILSNSDIITTTTACINSIGGVVNISDTRVFNSSSGDAILLNNSSAGGNLGEAGYGSSNVNPNILANVYVEGNVDTGNSVTHVQTISGAGSISGDQQKYPKSSMLTYDAAESELTSTTVQGAINELANSHSESQLTTTIYVDASRTYDSFDQVGAKGTIDRPFLNILDAIAAVESGDTIFCFKGAYGTLGETITLPDNVNLIGMGQGKTNFYSKIITGSSGKCRLEHASFRGGLEINETTFAQYIFSSKPVTVNAALQGEGFGIEVASGDGSALIMNSSSDVTLTLNTISTPDDAPAISMLSTNTGALYLQTSRVENDGASSPTIDSRGGSVALLTTSLVNKNIGPVANLDNGAPVNSPNMLSGVMHSGGLDCGNAYTIVEGVHYEEPIGSVLLFRSSEQISYDPETSGLSATTVQEALDEINSAIGSGNAEDIGYTGTLVATNVKDALDELDAGKSDDGHNHNDIYYTETESDNKFVSKIDLADIVTHPLSAAYQEIELTSASSGDESGISPEVTYDFDITIDGTTTTETITPESATAGYQELGLTGVIGGEETNLASDTYYYKVEANGNGLVEYNIIIEPATQAEVVGTNDMSSGHDWYNYNADFSINVNGSQSNISFTINYDTITDIITEINSQIPVGASAYNESDHIKIATDTTGSSQTFSLTDGTNSPLSTFGITPGTYDGADATSGYHGINLDGNAVDGNESGLTVGNTYDIGAEIDGVANNLQVTFNAATQGYQELGLSGIDSSTSTSLAEGTTYYFQINTNEYNITTGTSVIAVNEETQITFTDDSANSNANYNSTYFDIYDLTSLYRVWFDVGGSGVAPADGGGTLVSIAITSTNTVDEIAAATASALNTLAPFSSTSTTSPITITHDNAGVTTDAVVGDAPVTINITQQGSDGDPADLTWAGILPLLNDATSDTYTPSAGEVYVWEIIGGDIRVTDQEYASYSSVDLTAGVTSTDMLDALGVLTSLETPVDGTDDDSTTYGSLIAKLNDVTSGAIWNISSGNIRLTSSTSGSSSSILLSNGTTNDLVVSLADINTTTNFLNTYQGEDPTPATTTGTVLMTNGYDFTSKNQNIVVNGVGYTMDQTTTSVAEVVSLLGNKIDTANDVTTFADGNFIGIRSNDYGSTTSFTIGTNGAAATMGISTGEYTGTDKTDTTWNSIVTLLDTSTTSSVTWSIEGDDVRCTYNFTGSNSTISLQPGDSGTDLYSALGATAPYDTAVSGTDATTKYSDVIEHLNTTTPTGATWTFESSGNIRVTRDEAGSSYSVSISSGSTNDLFSSFTHFSSLGTEVQGYDSDTTTGSDLIGVQGITDIQPIGKSVGEAGTLQEVLEGGVGQLRTAAPANPTVGMAYFDSGTNTLYIYNGTSWVSTLLS